MHISPYVIRFCAVLACSFSIVTCLNAAPTVEQRKAAKAIADTLTVAGNLYKEGKFKESANSIRSAQAEFEKLAAEADKELLEALEATYSRLKTAHSLLELEGEKLSPIKMPSAPTTKPVTKPETKPVIKPEPKPTTTPAPATPPEPAGTSFVKHVAPILVGRCGGCHVNKTSGKFSMATFDALLKGPPAGVVIFPGDPIGSRLIEVIEGGEMPPNGRGPSPAELATIKKWITEGAKFDGNDPQLNLARLSASDAPATAAPTTPTTPATPTGKETVSFAREIAPALVENCSGCHINAQRVRGGLNMTTFQQLLRGGDNGEIVMAGKPAESLLIGKLKGTADGQRMPAGGKPPLSDAMIAKVEKWISEGAIFDGPDPAASLDKVAALARAENSTHEQLSADRAEKANEYWRLGMPGIEKKSFETKNFLVLGGMGENSLKEIADQAEAIAPKVAEIFGAPTDQPLIKGRFTLFLFQTRYDYSEFGNMVEKRQLPKESRGHWRYSVVDAYGAIIPSRTDEYPSDVLIGQQLAGAYIASLGKLPPRWFAEGAALVAASHINPKDPRVAEWDAAIPSIVAEMQAADDFITGKLPTESADIVAYGFVKSLMRTSKNFDNLLNALRKGEDFNKAFSQIYGGSPAQLADVWARTAGSKPAKSKPVGKRAATVQ